MLNRNSFDEWLEASINTNLPHQIPYFPYRERAENLAVSWVDSPPMGYLKCNIDCARFEDARLRGSDMILRDCNGNTISYMMTHHPRCPHQMKCEALVIHEAITWLNTMYIQQ
ncbi:hypothetical protein LINPERHAP2_LOCUS25440, partial [Linum perenne]